MATQPAPITAARQLERIARDVHDLAFDFLEPARDHRDADARGARIEDIVAQLRAAARGRQS
jgi:hypothetical protein